MYKITEFSRICKMSTRMLRHYDKEEILKPAYINPINGYRYYEQGQLEMALQIKKLREYRFPLSKIKIILQSSDQNSLIKHMKSQIMELSHEVREHLQVISEMSEMINRSIDLISIQRRHYDILIGMRSEITVITQRLQIDINDIDEHFDLLYEKVQVNNFQIIGSPSAIFYDEEYIPNHSDIELRIPIIYENTGNLSWDWEIKKLAQHQIVTTLHHGSYDDIGYGYMALEEWIKNNGYLIVAPPCEVYLKGPECDCPVEDYVTQICFSVIKK
ncbi:MULTISPECIES: MerR family transcriptional regulator [Bacillus]|uniref:MerR family transcriptional regulator n=1 Tax=Bacillus TaxID=1386 RepID=UPI0001A14598|nr:MerR family transcriptional regulator [Bacillus pseudomycoides]EEM16097.1 Transcriptional regulator, MerR [Bacillus pseudomycoides DSM 12442]MBD5798503.1 MerR family transcriptional regulator [Bacillus pseudomycoides]MED1477208.1 MerR family transcriptional regulator [Bacillus pseudomycoides]MED1598300.1 MerR family transcriptional regulator [Bacillus pseudomycoides]MED1625111.1 MerR family transcriptional regulator [Bacillus pseudomycoides]